MRIVQRLRSDIRPTLRWLRERPLSFVVIVLSLAMALGANVAIFSVFHALFLRPLPVADPERVVAVWGVEEKQGAAGRLMPISRPNAEDLRERNTVLSGLVDVIYAQSSLGSDSQNPQPVGVQMVPANYFEVLGLQPAEGRFFLPSEDEAPDRNPVVVLSHVLWQRQFAGDTQIVGRDVRLGGRPFTVVGVAPRGFTGTFVLGGPDVWVPSMMYRTFLPGSQADRFDERRTLIAFLWGRLRPGVSIEGAEAALRNVASQLEREYPDVNEGRSVTLMPLAEAAFPPQLRDSFFRSASWMLAVAVLVLLIALFNVFNLLMARSMERRKEFAIRLSQGADRLQLARLIFIECLLLTTLAGGLGLVLGVWGRNLLWWLRPPYLREAYVDLRLDWVPVALTVCLVLLSGAVLAALLTRSARPDLVQALKEGGGPRFFAGRSFSTRDVLMAAQVTLTLIALTGCGLFITSLQAGWDVDLGFDVDRQVILELDPSSLGLGPERIDQIFDQSVDRARALPGVTAATLATNQPLTMGGFQRTVNVEGRSPEAENNGVLVPADPVGLEYFDTTGVELERGRDFERRDREGAPLVAVINRAMADQFWPGEGALGRRFQFLGDDRFVSVVGIAADSKYSSMSDEGQPYIYLSRFQYPEPAMSLVVRGSGEPAKTLRGLREAIREIEPNLPLTQARTMPEVVRDALWPARFGSILLGILSFLALVLAVGGVYGNVRYALEQRRWEIGLRIALGALIKQVVRDLVRRVVVLVSVGLLVGAVVAVVGQRMLESVVFGLDEALAVPLVVAGLVLIVVTIVGTLIPARAIAKVDPKIVLETSSR